MRNSIAASSNPARDCKLAQLYFSNENGAIAHEPRGYAVRQPPSKLSIYIHIPFCAVRCGYCAFNTYTDRDRLIPDYVTALGIELAFAAQHVEDARIHTVYFGGGTPSLLQPRHFEQILGQLSRRFRIDDDAEISLEANPDNLSAPYLRSLRQLGLNRVSIGMQSANDAILKMFDRQHDLAAVAAAVDSARRAQFDKVNLDLIFGAPGETLAAWQASLAAALELAPDHLSIYGLELKGGTQLRLDVDAGDLPRPDDDVFADMYEHTAAALERANYRQYEISNWCKPGMECRHNLQYWRNLDYLGIGAGAHGYLQGQRYSVIAAPERYIAALMAANDSQAPAWLSPAVAKSRPVTPADELYETLMMGLRLTREGISRACFRRRFGCDIVDMFPDATRELTVAGLLEVHSQQVRISAAGRLLSNAVIREFVDDLKI